MINVNDSVTHILLKLINMHHPYGSIENILNFLWCIWKSRNDCLFNKIDGHPFQIYHAANAITQNLEMVDVLNINHRNTNSHLKSSDYVSQNKMQVPQGNLIQGETLKTDLLISGSKVYTDAAWKTKKNPRDTRNHFYRTWHLLSHCRARFRGEDPHPSFYYFPGRLSASC